MQCHILCTLCAFNCIFKINILQISSYFLYLLKYLQIFRQICIMLLNMLISAYFVHIYTYLLHIWEYKCIWMHIPVLHAPCTGQLRAFPGKFWFHFTATSSHQLFIASKHHHPRASSRSLGRAGAGACICQNLPKSAKKKCTYLKKNHVHKLPKNTHKYAQICKIRKNEIQMHNMQNYASPLCWWRVKRKAALNNIDSSFFA